MVVLLIIIGEIKMLLITAIAKFRKEERAFERSGRAIV